MILFEGLESIVESVYLSESLCDKTGSPGTVFVNPENTKYIIGRTVIINTTDYPQDSIKNLLNNNCKVISRVNTGVPGAEVHPYITRLNFYVMWNGRILNDLSELNWDDGVCNFSLKDYILYFPKIKVKESDPAIMDAEGNLTFLGWVLHQVGVNLDSRTPFVNLDVIKTKKVDF